MKVELQIPKLRQQTFETAIIERYRRRESSVEEALIEMYLAGVSVRRVEDITEALWGTRVSPATVSNLNKKIYATIEAWRNRPIEGDHPYVYLDGIAEVFPHARWQRCIVHWYRNAFAKSPRTKVAQIALMLKAIHSSESRSAAEVTAQRVRATLDDMKLSKLGEWIAATVGETLTYHQFPAKHWRKIRTNNALEP